MNKQLIPDALLKNEEFLQWQHSPKNVLRTITVLSCVVEKNRGVAWYYTWIGSGNLWTPKSKDSQVPDINWHSTYVELLPILLRAWIISSLLTPNPIQCCANNFLGNNGMKQSLNMSRMDTMRCPDLFELMVGWIHGWEAKGYKSLTVQMNLCKCLKWM